MKVVELGLVELRGRGGNCAKFAGGGTTTKLAFNGIKSTTYKTYKS